MKKIPLSQNKFALVDDETHEDLVKYNWQLHKAPSNKIYAYIDLPELPKDYAGKHSPYLRKSRYKDKVYEYTSFRIFLHWMVLNPIQGKEVDHINGNSLDNRKENLRLVTHAQNMMNKRIYKNNKCGLKGVRFSLSNKLNPWRAEITHAGKKINLGCHSSAILASLAYKQAANRLFGEYAYRNI